MPRFDKLEFGPSNEEPSREAKQEQADLDESHWIRKADEERRRGLYENALRYYSRALEQDKSLVTGWLGQVQMLILLEEAKEAEVWSCKALELFPGNGDLMAGRAQAHCRMGDYKKAHALSDGSIRQEGVSAYRWMVRGELMAAGRQGVEAHCFDKAQQIEKDWIVPLEISLIYLYYRCPGKALNRVRLAVEAVPERFYPWYVQGLCQMRVGLDRHARESFNRCQELCPGHADSRTRLAELDAQAWSPGQLWRRLFGRR